MALFPLTFLVLLSRKVYGLSKAALLSQIAPGQEELLRSDAHIARSGTAAGGAGTIVAGLLLSTDHVEAMLIIAAVSFMFAAFVSRGLPNPAAGTRHPVPPLSEAIPEHI